MGKIFPGGARGKTTWRKQIAIPALKAAGDPTSAKDLDQNQRSRGHWDGMDGERDGLNRGRLFVRTMAEHHGAFFAGGRFKNGTFPIEDLACGFLVQRRRAEEDNASGQRRTFTGRKWYIDPAIRRTVRHIRASIAGQDCRQFPLTIWDGLAIHAGDIGVAFKAVAG